jgi:hypothetical protein
MVDHLLRNVPTIWRRAAAVLALQVIVVAALVGTGLYRPSESGSAISAGTAQPVATSVPTLPDLPRAVTLGGEAGDLAVGLFVERSTTGSSALGATVLGGDGLASNGLKLTFEAQGHSGSARATGQACGGGCYTARIPVAAPMHVTVRIERPNRPPVSATFELPPGWPLPSATSLVLRAAQTYSSLRSVVYDETLASDPTHSISTHWKLEAPNRLSYQIAGGAAGVVIGNRRWDQDRPGDRWQSSAQTPLRLPLPPWRGQPVNAHVLGTATVDGRPAVVVSFLTRGYAPTWFTLTLDERTMRLLDLSMVTTAHFMNQRYTGFNVPPSIQPPR